MIPALLVALALDSSAGLTIHVHPPQSCALSQPQGTIARWRAYKDGVLWRSRKGQWTGTFFTCKDLGISKDTLAQADYISFDSDHISGAIMCIHGRPEKCPVPLQPPEGVKP